MTARQHGDRARYVWGPDEDDQPGRPCRCDDCTAASSAYERNRERQVLYGRWQPYVDAAAAREHLRELAANGIGWRRAAVLAGVGNGTVSKILYGGPGDRPPTKRIRPDTEAKILGVLPSTDLLADHALVDATGSRRRVQALVAVGHSMTTVATRLGVTRANFGTAMKASRLTAATVRAIRDIYDDLWDTPPDESTHRTRISASRARNMAAARGWPPPMAWDDDTIDDPAASPADGWQRPTRLSLSDRAEEALDLVALEAGSYERAAVRLGVKPDTLRQTIARAGRAS